MQWLSLDTKVQMADVTFRALLDEDEGAYCRFELLCCLAKEAADMDPDRWQGHLVSPTGRPLTVEDFARSYAYTGRNRVTKMSECLEKLERYGLVGWSAEHSCWMILDWLRWWKKSAKPSTERVQRYRARLRDSAPETTETRYAVTPETCLPNPTQPNNIPPYPQGGMVEESYGSEDPEKLNPDEEAKLEQPASSDPNKLASQLTLRQFRAMKAICYQRLTTLSPAGINTRGRSKLDKLLDCLPPPHWREGPLRWAHHLAHWLSSAVTEVQEQMDKRRDHGINAPVDLALQIAGNACAEELAKSRKQFAEVAHGRS